VIAHLLSRSRPYLPRRAMQCVDMALFTRSLVHAGWFRCYGAGVPVSRDGSALPWYTYPSIAFLEPRIPTDAVVFEYGMGNSTLWWAKRAQHVISCEGDKAWFEKISSAIPDNVEAILADVSSEDYVGASLNRSFDILVIDGRRRVACSKASLPQLTDRGVIIWDNAERDRYDEGLRYLADSGFKRLDFWGFGPLNPHQWLTSVLYRPANILGI